MTYTGDNKLSAEIQQRVVSTYEQSRDLALEGKVPEAKLGCEFVLRLDPLFEPARDLMQKLESGEPIAEPTLETGDEPGGVDDAAAPELPPEPGFDLQAELADLLDRRDFHTLQNLVQEHRLAVDASPEMTQIAVSASARLEAEPYVRAFIDDAEKAQRDGRPEDAMALLEKVRVLDPSHPSLPPEPRAAVVNETNDRIRELLEEGQAALDGGDFQSAIDSWSRIFLIDIDHGEANHRIEEARRLKAESERKIEEAFHEGVSLWELGSTDKAREQFDSVLELSPSHSGAKGYIERMERSDSDAPSLPEFESNAALSPDAEIFAPPDSLPSPGEMSRTVSEPAELPGDEDSAEPEEPRASPVKRKVMKSSGLLANRRFLMIAGLTVVAVAAVGGLLYSNWDRFFPNSAEALAAPDVLNRAKSLEAKGQTAMAINQLRQVASDHPQYAEAQALIAQWEAPVEEEIVAPEHSDEQLAERDKWVAEARQAREGREYLRASKAYARAAKIAPLLEEDELLQGEVQQRLEGLEPQMEMYEMGDWEFVLPELWRLHTANPEDRDVVHLMVSSYYNLGVRDLQRGDTVDAVEKFARAVELDSEDAEVRRLLRFSRLYSDQPADLLYKVFVKYLPFR